MTLTIAGAAASATVRAVAVVGFYRGDLVEPGTVLDIPESEFAILKGFNQVDYAPAPAASETPLPIMGKSSKAVAVEGKS